MIISALVAYLLFERGDFWLGCAASCVSLYRFAETVGRYGYALGVSDNWVSPITTNNGSKSC